jgi:hypothetical protein
MRSRLKKIAIILCLTAPTFAFAEDLTNILNFATKQMAVLDNNKQLLNNPDELISKGKMLHANELTDLLVQRVGVTPAQAMGGTGALLQVAKTRMAPQAFEKVSQNLPDVPLLLSAVPALQSQSGLGSLGGLGGGLAGKLAGASGGSLGSIFTAVSTFQQLGMKPDTMQRFIPVVMDYVKSAGH